MCNKIIYNDPIFYIIKYGVGDSIALSNDGNTLAVGASRENSNATGINGNEADISLANAGAVYLYRFVAGWSQQAYIKASNTENGDFFGFSVDLSADGNTLAVSSIGEDSNATGINGDEVDNSLIVSGAVFLYRFSTLWTQEAYIKASNTGNRDQFGVSVVLSADGNTLLIGAHAEGSNATGINGNEADDSLSGAGAVYRYRFSGGWSQQTYIKSPNGDSDLFGISIALSADGNTLAVGALSEDSADTGINGNAADNSATDAGVVYLY